jgi:hypothetical protein
MPLEIIRPHLLPTSAAARDFLPKRLVVAYLVRVGFAHVPGEVLALGAAFEGFAVGALPRAGVVVLVFSVGGRERG